MPTQLLYLCERLRLPTSTAGVPAADMAGSKIQLATPLQMLLDVLRISLLYRLGVWQLPSAAGATPPPSPWPYEEVDMQAELTELPP